MTRQAYPRPELVRDGDWQNLNGTWQFAFDDNDQGMIEEWAKKGLPGPKKINVPFVYQAKLSGINDQKVHDIVWYQRTFKRPDLSADQRVILNFGAVDYFADVYVNGQYIGHHEGGDIGFAFDVTAALNSKRVKQTLTVRACDRTEDETLLRGKQSWTGHSNAIWYTNSTGIWQTVWIELVSVNHVTGLKLTPDLDHRSVQLEATVPASALGSTLSYTIKFHDQLIVKDALQVTTTTLVRSVDLIQRHIFRTAFHNDGWTWTPEHPNLFTVDVTLSDEVAVQDSVHAYFGLRKVSVQNGMIMLNNRPYYQRLVLDQGYWPEGLLTAPDDDSFAKDIKLAKAMGFNGCRKHQKVEDPQFLYEADHLGYLVWEETASAPFFAEATVDRLVKTWQETIHRDYNHPSIIMWVPFNESWGVDLIHEDQRQQHFTEALYHLVHALDDTRLVQSNDGWEVTIGDVVGIHNYVQNLDPASPAYQHFKETLGSVAKMIDQAPGAWAIFAKGFTYQGQPLVLSEFGGIGFDSKRKDGWGYTEASSQKDYLSKMATLMDAVFASPALSGFCYTQLTDVEQEVNGLLTADRKPKAEVKKLNQLFAFATFGRLDASQFAGDQG